MKYINGYKTYILAGLMVLKGLVCLSTGDIELATFLADPNLETVLVGLSIAALRASK